MQKHELKLDELENHATKSANELDERLQTVKNLIQEQDAYLLRAQIILRNRYNENDLNK